MSTIEAIRARKALLDLIREFKPEGLSDLDAAINVISNHAETIRKQTDEINALKAIIRQIRAMTTQNTDEL